MFTISRALSFETRHISTQPAYRLVLDHQPCRSCLCFRSSELYKVHVNTFPSPNSRQLLNPGRLTGVSGQCPGVTSGAFIICLVGSDPVYRGMQPQGAVPIIPIAQASSSLLLCATCWEDSCSLYLYIPLLQGKRGSKGQQPSYHCNSQLQRATCTFYRCNLSPRNICHSVPCV